MGSSERTVSDTDSSAAEISIDALQRLLATADPAVIIIDVRRREVFARARHMIAAAQWRDPEQVEQWGGNLDPGREVVVYCVHGHEVSQGVTRALRAMGCRARFIGGGYEAWESAGGAIVRRQEQR